MSVPDHVLDAKKWIRFADEDLQAAESLLALGEDEMVPRHVCWLAQQGAEKALKSGLVFHQIEFPFRHDLDALRNLLPETWEVRRQHPDLAALTEWAVEARYPGDWPDATVQDARESLHQARAVYESVRDELGLLNMEAGESMED